MPALNTTNGKAFEYACLKALYNKLIGSGINSSIQESDAFITARSKYESLSPEKQLRLDLAAQAGIRMISSLEPKIENGVGTVVLAINKDAAAVGTNGDVRDILCIRSRDHDGWEIGISCKHNHAALKHPRITEGKDFGSDWIGYPCSNEFIQNIGQIVSPLMEMGKKGVLWRDVHMKKEKYYYPILLEYLNELRRLCDTYPDASARLLSYFFGSHDFYKVIDNDSSGTTTIEAFNMHGSLGQTSGRTRPIMRVSQLSLPTRLIDARFKNNSKTTIILTFDGGWSVKMRLHNKDSVCHPTSLAWDVQLEGLPTDTYLNTRSWLEE